MIAPDDTGSLILSDGAQETNVVSIAPGVLSLASQFVRRAGIFTLIWERGPDRLEMQVNGRVSPDGHSLALDGAEAGAAFAPFIDGTHSLDATLFRSAFGTPRVQPAEPRHYGRAFAMGLVVVLCTILAAYDGVKLYRALVVITPRVAYLSTEVSTINSPTSGRLAFAAGAGDVSAGEPILGVENVNGKTVLIDAKNDVRIVSQDRRIGELVRRGEPLLAVADTDPAVYLVAVMSREEAFQLGAGATVKYSVLGMGEPVTESLFVPGDQFERTLLPDPTNSGVQLYQVRFRITDTSLLSRAAPVTLEFDQTLDASLAAALGRIGVPADLVARLLEPLHWLNRNQGAAA